VDSAQLYRNEAGEVSFVDMASHWQRSFANMLMFRRCINPSPPIPCYVRSSIRMGNFITEEVGQAVVKSGLKREDVFISESSNTGPYFISI
jgi:hypothetical protein